MSEDRKVNLVFAAENQTKGTLQEIKQDVASTATSIEQSGKKAAQGIEAIGDGGEKAASKLDGSTRSIIGSIQRTTATIEAGEKGSAKYFETLAKQRGIGGDVLEPYLAQLRKAEAAQAAAAGSLGKMGQTAGQTRQALQQLPMQFQDIVVSLQAGQQPLTVMLQQGSQLAGSFGGAGAAAKALGSYVLELVSPLTAVAAAAAGIGIAYIQGSKEADNFRMAIVTTGNASGVTTSQLRDYARQIDAVVGTQAQAAAGLAEFVAAGVRGGDELRRYAQTAIEWEKATGEAVDKTAEKFASLQKDPLAGVLKLNEGTNFLTVSVYEQIKALDDQGRKAEASKVAMEALDSAMSERARTIAASLGYLERGWRGVTGAAKDAWDAMLNVGRAATIGDQLATVRKELSELLALSASGFGETAGGAATGRSSEAQVRRIKERIDALRSEESALLAKTNAEKVAAAASEESARKMQALTDFNKKYQKALDGEASLQEKLAIARREADAAGKSESDWVKVKTAITEEHNKSLKKGESAQKAYNRELEQQKSLIAELSGLSSTFYKDWDSLNKQYSQGRISVEALGAAQAKLLAQQPAMVALAKEEAEQQKARIKVYEEEVKAQQKLLEHREKAAVQVEDTLRKARDEEDAHILAAAAGITHAEALAKIAFARAEDTYQKELAKGADAETLLALQRELDARRELITVMSQKGVREANKKAADDAAKNWEKTSQLIGTTLADYIMGGGKDAATYLKRLFATLVLQPVVQYGVNSAMGALGMGQQGKDAQSVLGGNNVGTTVLNNSGMIGAGYQAAFGASVGASSASLLGANAAGMMGGDALGALIAGNGGWAGVSAAGGASAAAGGASAAGSLMSGIAAAAPYLAAVVALYAIISGMDDSGTPHMGMNARWSAKDGLHKSGEYSEFTALGMGQQWDSPQAQAVGGAVGGLAQMLGSSLDAFAVAFGKQAGYVIEAGFADDSSKDGAWGGLRIVEGTGAELVNWNNDRQSRWAPREFADGEEGYKQYLAAVATDVKGAFLAMDLPAWADQILETANDIDTLNAALQQIGSVKAVFDGLGKSMSMFADLGGAAQTALLSVAGGIDALSSVAGSYYQAVYSEQERLAHARAQMEDTLAGFGATMPATREEYRALVEQQIAAGAAGAEFAVVLMGLAGVFGSVVDNIDAEFAGLADSVKGVFEPLIGSIGDLRSEVAATIAQIKRGTEAMSAEDIRAAIAGVASVDAPGTAGVTGAQGRVSTAQGALGQAELSSSAAKANQQAALDRLAAVRNGRDGVAEQYADADRRRAFALSEAAKFEPGGMYYEQDSYSRREYYKGILYPQAQSAANEMEALKPALDAYNLQVAQLESIYGSASSSAAQYASQLAAAQAAVAAAQQAEVQARVNYAAEVSAFVQSSDASVGKLSDLRGEVLQYFEAQAQAVQAMIATAEQLRDVVGSIRMGQLDSAQTVAQLSGSYASDYSMALATTGSMRAEYAASMGATLPALADALKTEAATSSDWRVQTAKLLAQASNISGMLDKDAEAIDYEDEALGLLGSIDEALLKLETGTKSAEQVIAQAIENGTAAQLAGMRAIVAALQGGSVPAFAAGGMHLGGLRLVGERGPELEATGPSRIWNAQQTRALMGGGGPDSNAALVAEIRALRSDNQAQASAMVQMQRELNKLMLRWDAQGMPEERVL